MGPAAGFGWLSRFRVAYFVGLLIIFVSLLLEHWLARRRSLKWINIAFFRLNALISIVFLRGTVAEVAVPRVSMITMNFFLQRSELRDLYDKVAAGERISEADALRLFESKDLNAVGAIADFVRQRKNGNRASYIINRYINYSNYCILSCQFCSFARKKRDADGFQLLGRGNRRRRPARRFSLGITELHIVGGLHPSLPFSYYTDMLQALSAARPAAAVEMLHGD